MTHGTAGGKNNPGAIDRDRVPVLGNDGAPHNNVIDLQMKGSKMNWSNVGATHAANILACSKNGDLSKMIG